ncbi:MAG: phage baseplate assembly protein V [Pseudohongiellaceae bacterium]
MINFSETLRLIHNLIRVGTIDQVDVEKARCRVRIGDLITGWVPWISPRAGATRDWDPPTIGEQVVLLSPGGELTTGVALPGIYTKHHPAPSQNQAMYVRVFPDGARIEYDHEASHLVASLPGSAQITAANGLTVDADTVINGNATINGDVSFSGGSVTHEGTDIGATHKHSGVQSGGSITGGPV